MDPDSRVLFWNDELDYRPYINSKGVSVVQLPSVNIASLYVSSLRDVRESFLHSNTWSNAECTSPSMWYTASYEYEHLVRPAFYFIGGFALIWLIRREVINSIKSFILICCVSRLYCLCDQVCFVPLATFSDQI